MIGPRVESSLEALGPVCASFQGGVLGRTACGVGGGGGVRRGLFNFKSYLWHLIQPVPNKPCGFCGR